MAVKLIIIVVVVSIIPLESSEGKSFHSKRTFVHSSDEINDMRNTSTAPITELNSFNEYLNSTINTAKRVINALPSPKQILHYGKQALIGVPEEIVSDAKRFLCKSYLNNC